MGEDMQKVALGFIKAFCSLNKPMNSNEDYHELMKDTELILDHPSFANIRYDSIMEMVRRLMRKKDSKKLVFVTSMPELAFLIGSLNLTVLSPENAVVTGQKVDCYICGPGTFPLVKATNYIIVGCFNDYSFSDVLMKLRYGRNARSVTREDWKINFEDKYDTIHSVDSICDTIRFAADRLVVPEIIKNNLLYLKEKLIRANLTSAVNRTDAIIMANETLGELLQRWSKNPTVANWLMIITNV